MTLPAYKTWIAGEILTAADLNASFNNILNNGGGTLISPLAANLNFANNQATNLVLEKLGTDPASATTGRIYYNTATRQVMLDDGTGIHAVGPLTGTTSGIGVGSYVRGLAGVVSTNTAAYTAFTYLFQTTDGLNNFLMRGANAAQTVSLDFRTAGPINGGRDQAGTFATNQVHVYAITTGANSTAPGVVCSTNNPFTEGGPTLPSSYAGWAYLHSLCYDVTSSMAKVSNHTIAGSRSYLLTTSNFAGGGQGNGAGLPVLTDANAEVETSVLVSIVVPRIAPSMLLQNVGSGGLTSAGGVNCRVQSVIESDFSKPIATIQTRIDGVTSGRLNHDNSVIPVPNLNNPPSFVYYNIATTGFGSALLNINVLGYTNSNGDQD